MKKSLLLIINIFIINQLLFSQSTTILPNRLSVPNVSVLETCDNFSKGSTVFNTTDNKMYYCNGTNWINTGSGSSSDWASNGNYTYTTKPFTNVGIGTTTPESDLSILGTGGEMLKLKSTASYMLMTLDSKTGDGYLAYNKDGVQKYSLGTESFGDFYLYQEGNGRIFSVDAATGFTSFNHTEPAEILDIKGRVRIRKSGGATAGIWYGNSTNSILPTDGAFLGLQNDQTLGIYMGTAWKMSFTNVGNMTIAGTLSENSDERLKKDIAKLENPLAVIEALNGYHYHWKSADRDPKLQTGLLAQEVEKTMPELVTESTDGIKSVNYSGLIPYLIEAVKILNQKNEKLEKEINKILKSKL